MADRVKSAKRAGKVAKRTTPSRAKDPSAQINRPNVSGTHALYLYGLTKELKNSFAPTSEAVDGIGMVEPFFAGDVVAWVSKVSRQEFAENLQSNLENLDWLAACSVRHQKVLAEIGQFTDVLPTRFGTVYLSCESLESHIRERGPELKQVFERIANAEEWGVKVFAALRRKPSVVSQTASGADYLRLKAQAMQRAGRHQPDSEIEKLGAALADLSVAATTVQRSGGQVPSLVWNASFLVKRDRVKQFEQVLREFSRQWGEERRIEATGPWPPYSFVGENGKS